MNADIDGGTVSLLSLDALDVDNKLLTIHLHDLAHLLTFVVTSHNLQHKRPLNVHITTTDGRDKQLNIFHNVNCATSWMGICAAFWLVC